MEGLVERLVHGMTHGAAWVVSRFRPLHHVRLSDHECAALGLPEGSTEPAVMAGQVTRQPWWRFDVWLDDEGQGCLNINAFGYHCEVFYVSRREVELAVTSPAPL